MYSYAIQQSRYGVPELIKTESYEHFTTPIEVLPDINYYFVMVEYTTGDSFGSSPGQREYIDLYRNRQDAEETAALIRRHYEFYKSSRWKWDALNTERYENLGTRQRKFADLIFGGPYTVKIKNADGVEYKHQTPWLGYFEHIDDIFVEKVQLR